MINLVQVQIYIFLFPKYQKEGIERTNLQGLYSQLVAKLTARL